MKTYDLRPATQPVTVEQIQYTAGDLLARAGAPYLPLIEDEKKQVVVPTIFGFGLML